jgi:hypothetical protein
MMLMARARPTIPPPAEDAIMVVLERLLLPTGAAVADGEEDLEELLVLDEGAGDEWDAVSDE